MDTSTLLIDADIILYKVSWACQTEVEWGDLVTYSSSLTDMARTFDKDIKNLVAKTESSHYELCISSSTNFRKKIFSEYKLNRKATRKPLGYKKLVAHAMANHPYRMIEDLEADDVLGMRMTAPDTAPYKMTASIDKDMLTIPGKHYNIDKDIITTVSEAEADYNFYTQILTGDTVDNYKGCPGIGPSKASSILQGCTLGKEWEAIVGSFKKQGLTEDDAILQARMARILRHEDYDYKKGEVILWNP